MDAHFNCFGANLVFAPIPELSTLGLLALGELLLHPK